MSNRMYYDHDADLSITQGGTAAVIGYGSQGHTCARSPRDSGADVVVGFPEGSRSRPKAEEPGLTVTTPADASARAGTMTSRPITETA